MDLWINWWAIVCELRPSCTRLQTFLWLCVCLIGMTIRQDLFGVTSIVRALGLMDFCYDRILDFYHSNALKIDKLIQCWVNLILKLDDILLRANGRLILVADGLKVAKSGKKMPAVKKLHQESESNTKPKYIMGHSYQAIGILAGTLSSIFCIPLISQIHEGLVFSNRSKKTVLDKMVDLVKTLNIPEKCYLVADAYYASQKIIQPLLEKGLHLITRVRFNAVAYEQVKPPENKKRGRKKKYGKKIKLKSLAKEKMKSAQSPVYGEKNITIQYRCIDLLWRPVGIVVRFVITLHPKRGMVILMSSDLSLDPLEIIKLYSLRFKIEIAFKQAIRILGTYAYHFWMRAMTPIQRKGKNQYLHKKSKNYREQVTRKIMAYHAFVQIGLIAQGILQYLSITLPDLIWANFGSWIRTIRPGICPSEMITATALRNTFPKFLGGSEIDPILAKFIQERIDIHRFEGLRLTGS